MRELVESARVGHLATVDVERHPHLVPVCFTLSGDALYTAVDHKPKRHNRLRRIANIEATGHAALLVDRYSEDWSQLWWVRVDAAARVVADLGEFDRAREALAAKYQQYREHPPDGPVLALDVVQISGWSAAESASPA
jgi:PPOX class probable F420-dependent enzyme